MNIKNIRLFLISAIIILSQSQFTLSSPIIKVDSTHVHLGSLRKTKIKHVVYEHRIRNTGDDTLFIKRVKPG